MTAPTQPDAGIMREDSGAVNDARPMVSFVYILLRDYLPAGSVESAVMHAQKAAASGGAQFTNGWLARYAQHIVGALAAPPDSPTQPDAVAEARYPNIEAIAAGTIAGNFRDWPRVRPEARALLAELARLRAAAAPPREPTEAMRLAGWGAYTETYGRDDIAAGDEVAMIWRAMLDAAPQAAPAGRWKCDQCDLRIPHSHAQVFVQPAL